MEKKKIVELLNNDLQDEHGAIIQYLQHAYAMGEGELSCEVEAIAREEMRHLDWLAETIVELGGQPSLVRGTMNMDGTTVPDWMQNDVGLETGAIHHYDEHIEIIDDPKVKRLLRRIRADEVAHHQMFEHFVEKSREAGLKDVRGERRDELTKMLNWGVGHEYTVVLQYMFHSYMSHHPEAKKQLEDQAVNEMQHLGWLAEEVVDAGGTPVLEHTQVDQTADPSDMLKSDIKLEQEVAERYDKSAGEVADAGIKRLLLRMRDNELYHHDVFRDLLANDK